MGSTPLVGMLLLGRHNLIFSPADSFPVLVGLT